MELTTPDASARRSVPGSFIRLSDGVTHYELSGPDTGKIVVLVHGFSVPYYMWDSTCPALVREGFRVLRYDAFGRGFSIMRRRAGSGPTIRHWIGCIGPCY